MHQIFFHYGKFSIYWFGIMAATGFIAATLLMHYNRKDASLSQDNVFDITFVAIIAGILGARLFYVVQFWEQYRDRPLSVFRIDQGGLVFYGGMLCATFSIYLYCRWKKLQFIRVIDVFAPSLAAGHLFGRIGCFMNGCCFGKPSDLPWAVHFPPGSFPDKRYPGLAVHPTQLYESLFNLALFLAMMLCLKRLKNYPGLTASIYLLAYGTGRFIIEMLRGDSVNLIFGVFTAAQFTGIFIVAAGAAVMAISFNYARAGKTD
jgi:phosphatidylglycerol---prolipoprotein diacylglyceryl transferase